MGYKSLVTRGRYQPFGNHHAAVFDYFMAKHGVDKLYVLTEGLSSRRTPTSPFRGDEVAEMIEDSFEEDYDVDYEVEVVNHDDIFDKEVFDIFEEEVAYFTRERSHAAVFAFLKAVYDLAFWSNRSLGGVYYEPRGDMTPFERFDRPVETSSTRIREMIKEGNDEWRSYVSDTVENFIDENDEAREAIGRDPESGKYVGIIRDAFF